MLNWLFMSLKVQTFFKSWPQVAFILIFTYIIAGPLCYHINACNKQDLNLGPMALSLLEFEIVPKTTHPPRLDGADFVCGFI